MDVVSQVLSIIDGALYNSVGAFLVVLGILISIRFAGFPDLTVDGSFTIGAALYAVGIKSGFPVVVCFLMALSGGAVAGSLTATLNEALKLGKIISSILVMLFLITVSPYLTGGSTVGLLTGSHWLAKLENWDISITSSVLPGAQFSLHPGFVLVFAGVGAAFAWLVGRVFTARLGVQIRYLGSAKSPSLLTASERRGLLFVALAASGALVGLGGAIEAERHGGFNQNIGIGTILIGLACLILGESIVKTRARRDNLQVREYLWAAGIGVVTYTALLQVLLWLGLTFLDVRLTTTVFLLILLAIASRRHPNSARLF